ncbi:MAG: Hsp20/alpha crystallin family protein [Myxococcota bacterium]|jgi:HSP20 family protein
MSLIRRTSNTEAPSALARQSWDPFDLMQQMLRWDPFAELGRSMPRGAAFAPAFDVRETKDAFIFKADIPGLEEKDLDVSVSANRVTISGQRQTEHTEEGDAWYTAERAWGAFSRTFSLPDGADVDHAEAELKHGVLTVVVPKRAEAKPRRLSLKGLLGRGEKKTEA